MARSKFDLSQKGFGFYAACLAAVLCLVTGIYYNVQYTGDQYYAANIFYTFAAALPVALVMALVKQGNFVPAALCAFSGIGFLEFIYAMYWDISVVMVGIDKTSFDTRFIVCCVLMVVSFVIAEISLYTKMRKANK